MSVRAFPILVVAVFLGLLTWATPVHAEKVKTNQSTKLYSRAGEQSPVLLSVKAGQTMTLLKQDGRWLKVRVGGRTGWVPRSKVDLPEGDGEDDVARNTRRRPFVDGRGTKRGFGGEAGPDDRVGADATGNTDDKSAKADAKPQKSEAAEPANAKPETEAPGDRDDDKVAAAAAEPDGDKSPRPAAEVDQSVAPGQAGRTRVIMAKARAGGAVVNQKLSSNGTVMGIPDNYTAASSAVTFAVGGSVLYPYKTRLWLGGELDYDYDMAVPGIDFKGVKNGFTYHDLDARLIGGYGFPSVLGGTAVFLRLGFHYDSFQVADVADFTKNTSKLPSQIVSGPTVGLGAAMPNLIGKLGVAVAVDAIAFGSSVEQTKNLEDGTGPSATAVFANFSVMYHLTPKLDIQAAYDGTFESISFTGIAPATSVRGHTGTTPSSRSDSYNIISAGIGYGF